MKKKTSLSVPTSFLQKTYDMLNNESLSDIITWNADGTEFIIYSMNEFSEKILPIYFKHSNFASFIRQLNMYDFHKLRSGTQEHIYKHPLFIRGRADLLKEIHRKTSESNWPVVQKQNLTKNDMSPVINKLVQLHKQNSNYESQITSLEDQVSNLTAQNKILADQLWENKDMINKIEKALMFFARVFKQNKNSDDFSFNLSSLDNVLSITDVSYDNSYKKPKVIENYSVPQSPLSFTLFEEELRLDKEEENDKVAHFTPIDVHSDMSFDADKIDFLLDQ